MWPCACGRFPPVAIFLFMAAAAIHRTGARRGLMIIIFNQGVAIPADGLFFFSVDGGVKFIDRDLKFTFGTADLVAIDAVLGCIGKSCLCRREYQNHQTESQNLSHDHYNTSSWIMTSMLSSNV